MASNNDNNQNEGIDNEKQPDELEEDYYAILNLSRDATDKDITQAYHRFGRIYHPDKHKNFENKRNAEILFAKIKKVYDVLSDPHKRAIYDSIGVKGLKQDGWQIISRTKTPKEIREEYERLAKEKEEKRLRELTNSQGHFSMGINATKLFDDYGDSEDALSFSLKEFSMAQHLDIALTNKDSSSLSVAMELNERRLGNASLVSSFRRILSPESWVECSTTFGSGKGIEIKGFRRLTQRCSGTLSGMFNFHRNSVIPSLGASVGYQLSKNINGRIIYRSGLKSYMKTVVEYDNKDIHVEIACQLSIKNTYISCEVNKQFMNNSLILRSSIKYGYLGFIFDYGIRKKITEFSNLSASMLIGNRIGVLLNIRLDRATQSFVFPIHLSEDILPSAIFYGSVAPIAFYFIFKKLIIEPYIKDKDQKDIKEKQEKLKSELAEKRRQALAAQDLMEEALARSIDKEGPNGLIIILAYYGNLPANIGSITNETDNVINVKIPLQVLTKDHSLQISTDSTKSDLQGFYDPCIGESKSLYIKYKFNSELHEATFDDHDIVRIPKKAHRILN